MILSKIFGKVFKKESVVVVVVGSIDYNLSLRPAQYRSPDPWNDHIYPKATTAAPYCPCPHHHRAVAPDIDIDVAMKAAATAAVQCEAEPTRSWFTRRSCWGPTWCKASRRPELPCFRLMHKRCLLKCQRERGGEEEEG